MFERQEEGEEESKSEPAVVGEKLKEIDVVPCWRGVFGQMHAPVDGNGLDAGGEETNEDEEDEGDGEAVAECLAAAYYGRCVAGWLVICLVSGSDDGVLASRETEASSISIMPCASSAMAEATVRCRGSESWQRKGAGSATWKLSNR